jgi:hypothetical protein
MSSMRGIAMRTLLVSLCLLASVALARAQTPSVEFDGQVFYLAYEDEAGLPKGPPGNGLAEFTLQGETLDTWTKLFAFHAYPSLLETPAQAASDLGKVLKQVNKDANYALTEDKETGDAIIDFLTWSPGSDVMEFNVFKYSRAGLRPGLVALQFAQRFKLGTYSVEAFRALRERAVANMAGTDVTQVRAYFAAKAKETGIAGPAASTRAGIAP